MEAAVQHLRKRSTIIVLATLRTAEDAGQFPSLLSNADAMLMWESNRHFINMIA